MEEKTKLLPKRIVCITQMEDDSIVCSYFGCTARHHILPLLGAADRQARKRLAMGIPLSPEESAGEKK